MAAVALGLAAAREDKYKYATQTQIHIHKYKNTYTQIHKYKYIYTNTQIQRQGLAAARDAKLKKKAHHCFGMSPAPTFDLDRSCTEGQRGAQGTGHRGAQRNTEGHRGALNFLKV